MSDYHSSYNGDILLSDQTLYNLSLANNNSPLKQISPVLSSSPIKLVVTNRHSEIQISLEKTCF